MNWEEDQPGHLQGEGADSCFLTKHLKECIKGCDVDSVEEDRKWTCDCFLIWKRDFTDVIKVMTLRLT